MWVTAGKGYVIRDWPRTRSGVYRNKFSKEFPVSDGGMVGAIDLYNILVKLTNFDYNARPVPFQGESTCLVLDADVVPDSQGREASGVLRVVRVPSRGEF